jgi:Sulphur transport
MTIDLTSLAFLVSALCAGLMGYAIQRGATCTVAAVDEVLTKGSARRLLSLAEASLWVAGGLLVLQVLPWRPVMPLGYELSGWTVLGAALLGLGAWIDGACVFGAIARFGSGQWAYALTPLGFYLGCLSVPWLFAPPAPVHLPDVSPVLRAPPWLAGLFVLFVVWRVARPLWRRAPPADQPAVSHGLKRAGLALAQRVWAPHAATILIGVTFLVMLVLVGAWAYTDLLAELARGMAANPLARSLLLLVMLLGAAAGGWTAGRWRSTPVSAVQALRCLTGGALMGWGSVLIPGGNDGLILIGMPLLWPSAWVAIGVMVLVIGIAQWLAGARAARASPLPRT